MVNPRLIVYLTGWILLLTGLTQLFPMVVGLIYHEESYLWFLHSFGIVTLFSCLLISLGYGAKNHEARTRDSMAVVGVSWFMVSLMGALPYWLSGFLDPWGSIFESFSGFSSTGATNIDDLSIYPKALLFWRCFSQYVGGMGIVVLMVAVLPFLGMGGQLMLRNELSGLSNDKLKPRVAQVAKTLWIVYLSFTLVLVSLYLIGGQNFYDSLCLTFATMSTAGFSNYNDSLGHFSGYYVPVVSLVFMFLGSISFSLHYQLFTGSVKTFFKNAEVVFFGVVILSASLIISGTLMYANYYKGAGETIFHSLFQVVSVISTTGHGTTDWGKWPELAVAVLFLLYFFGGCSGSTSGGLKCIRWLILFKSLHRMFRKNIHPRGVFPVRINGKPLQESVLEGVWIFLFLYFIALAAATLILIALGLDFLTSFTSVASALGNVGPNLGPLGPTASYAWMPGPAKGILSLCMLLGRLEFYSFIIIFIPEFWSR
jgi:trk system potassium uptake protein TrkH